MIVFGGQNKAPACAKALRTSMPSKAPPAGMMGDILKIVLVGDSGAGKTSISRVTAKILRTKISNLVLIQGNEMRSLLQLKGFSKKERISASNYSSELIKFLTNNGINVNAIKVENGHIVRSKFEKVTKGSNLSRKIKSNELNTKGTIYCLDVKDLVIPNLEIYGVSKNES